ncbi:MAG: neutral/alkaline non-lysosomal ceramidase N-terminal domain-containing protein [Planctomycetaceae bacterium]
MLRCLSLFGCLCACLSNSAVAADVLIGAAVVDITPDTPVRLTGYGNRTTEATDAAVRIHARALTIGPSTVLITVDNCGVPANVTEAVFAKVQATHSIPRERFAVCSTHTHSGPWLRGFAPNILTSLPSEHAEHLQQYETELIARLVAVVDKAFAAQQPGRISIGKGRADFAMNRRTLVDGRWTGFGETPDGPVDHQLPILAAHDTAGSLIAVLANYACHATTETGAFNQVSSDWPGFAADMIEAEHPGAVALIAIGCGADANPSPRGTHEQAQQHGRTVADEVQRLLATDLTVIDSDIVCRMDRIDLPLGPLPDRSVWEQQAAAADHAGILAQRFLTMLDNGQPVPTTIPDYPVQTWCFGSDIAMIMLGGEVVVDYSIRLNTMFDDSRLWINAYSNDVPCYIASKRLLREGGYEVDRSMVYYARPTRLAPEAEDLICDTVQKLLPHEFYSAELQSEFPGPKSPEESLACITVRPDLTVELVAAEPLITDPVAFDWDLHGRLWVVEMSGYPGPGTPREAMASDDGMVRSTGNAPSLGNENLRQADGRVRVLADTDGDGAYDTSTTFLDDLNFPTGLHPWRNGWIITAAPDILYAEDTDGDLHADVRKVLFTGFTEGNQQHRVNGLRWGLDGWLYLANGDSGGTVRAVSSVLADDVASTSPVQIGGRDLRIHPDTGAIETLSGQTQSGRNRDDFGNWFGNNNSNPIWHYVLEDQDLRRNPHAVAANTKAQVAEVPGAAPVFPTSRTLARFNDFGSANRFTSACSTDIYRDTVLGEIFHGNAFTCEPVHNLVSRLVLERDGVSFKGVRATDERASEFFASTDNWTRPVMVRTGPDGALYIADMYRQVIEHPQWIPAEYQRKLNLKAGEDKGRIYRILPIRTGIREPVSTDVRGDRAQSGNSDRLDGKREQEFGRVDLVRAMSSRNGWWRDTAQRLMMHDRSSQILQPLLELLQKTEWPAIQVHTLHAITQQDTSRSEAADRVIQAALRDENPEVRRAALQLITTPFPDHVWEMTNDPSPAVIHQLALTLGTSNQPQAATTLARLMQQNAGSNQIVTAAMTSLTPQNIAAVLEHVMHAETADAGMVGNLIVQAAAMQRLDAIDGPVLQMVSQVATSPADISDSRMTSLAQIITSLKRSGGGKTLLQENAAIRSALLAVEQQALASATRPDASDDSRVAALKFMSTTATLSSDQVSQLLSLLTPTSSPAVQQAAVTAILASSPDTAVPLFERWNTLTPSVRSTLLQSTMQTSSGVRRLLDAVAAKAITPGDLDATVRERLLNHRDDRIRLDAQKLLGTTAPSIRNAVVEDFRTQLSGLRADAAAGKAVFEKRCSVCHRLQDVGKQIGADLAALKDRSTATLLTAILDPNKAVEAKFLSYTAVTVDGKTHSGMLLNETANSITLLSTDGKELVLPRTDLEELTCSNRSLMPEGLEKDLTAQQLSDVIAFVQSSGIRWKSFPGNSPQVIAADSDGTLRLPATAAEIYGPNLIFEAKHENLGWWTSTDDYAVWNIDVPKSGHWTVQFEYACDNSTAGNALKLSTGTRLLTVRVPGSGTWDDYTTWTAGKIDLGGGRRQFILTAPEKPGNALIDLKTIRLLPPE